MPVTSILCPWCAWAAALTAGQDPGFIRARAREMVVEHVVTVHPERIDEAVENFETWLHADE